jgi:hypothetical protein
VSVAPIAGGGEALAAGLAARGRRLALWLDDVRNAGPVHELRHLRVSANRPEVPGSARDRFYRDLWTRAAASRGASCEPLGDGFLEIRRDGVWTRVKQQLVPLDDALTVRLALHKALVHRLLAEAGIPVPAHAEFTCEDLRPASALASDHGALVVKPVDGTGGGLGTT